MILSPNARRAVDDLVWYWREAEGDLGLESNFSAFQALLECGGPTGGAPITEIPERRIHAATRERHIRRALESIGAERAGVLRACLAGECACPPELGDAGAAAPRTTAAERVWRSSASARSIEEWLARLCHRVRHGIGERPTLDRMLVAEIRRESEALLLDALRAFARARRGQEAVGHGDHTAMTLAQGGMTCVS